LTVALFLPIVPTLFFYSHIAQLALRHIMSSDSTTTHLTVLLHEAVAGLAIQPDGIYVDGTFGRGGHSQLIYQQLSPQGQLIVFDKDPQAIAAAHQAQVAWSADYLLAHPHAQHVPTLRIIHAGFASMQNALMAEGIPAVTGILLDLGISSPQIDQPERGFSFRFDGPLDMRMNPEQGLSAAEWLNHATLEEITGVIRDYSEERFALQIAKAITTRCQQQPHQPYQPLTRTRELADLVAQVVPRSHHEKGQHPATRTFQAIRIHINQELAELNAVLGHIPTLLVDGGRLVVISFHSLEDRCVKRFVQPTLTTQHVPSYLPIRQHPNEVAKAQYPFKQLSKIKPSSTEINANPRSRSALMRVICKVNATEQV
jgi:16S rRNA (cytosine1402-N4)-methyltransferase